MAEDSNNLQAELALQHTVNNVKRQLDARGQFKVAQSSKTIALCTCFNYMFCGVWVKGSSCSFFGQNEICTSYSSFQLPV